MASDGYKIKVRPPPEVDKETGNPRIKNPFEKARPAEQLNWWDTDDGRMQATMISERVRRLAGLQEPSRWALALNMMLWMSFGVWLIIFSMSSIKPISNILSASSKIANLTVFRERFPLPM